MRRFLWSSVLDKAMLIKYNLIMKSVSIFKIASILTLFTLSLSTSLTYPTFSAEENPCLACHVELKGPSKSVHAVLRSGCQPCHTLVKGGNHPEQKDSIKLAQNVPGLCYSCHDKAIFKGKSLHPPVISNSCTACHNPHQSNLEKLLVKDIPGLCYNCHNESKFRGKLVHAPIRKGLCLSCHNAHASNFSEILISDSPQLCYSCHDKTPFTKKYVHIVAVIPNGCNLCHKGHVSDNPYLLLKPIVELCTSCHKEQEKGMHIVAPVAGEITHPVTGMPDPSDAKKELSCTSCHNPHSSKFAKLFPLARICTKCHQYY